MPFNLKLTPEQRSFASAGIRQSLQNTKNSMIMNAKQARFAEESVELFDELYPYLVKIVGSVLAGLMIIAFLFLLTYISVMILYHNIPDKSESFKIGFIIYSVLYGVFIVSCLVLFGMALSSFYYKIKNNQDRVSNFLRGYLSLRADS